MLLTVTESPMAASAQEFTREGECGIIAAKAAIILIFWPDDPQAKPAPVPLANDTTPLRFMV